MSDEFSIKPKVAIKSIAIIIGLTFLLGGVALLYRFVFEPTNKNIDHEVFKSSTQYIEGMVDDLAKYKLEIMLSRDEIEKSAISQMVISRFANFDINEIEDAELQQFLTDCRNGEYLGEFGK